jgi:Bacterial archaeo-eukaryotic release factor family 3
MKSMSIYRLSELLAPHSPPCISLYQPTHRHHPDSQQDPIRFRNLVTAVETSLRQKYSNRDVRPLLVPFRALELDREFWNYALDGLAALASPDSFSFYRLQRTVPELAVAADSLHVKPLIRFVQSADRYQVLCLSRQEAKLYEGNRDALDPIDLKDGIPKTSAETHGDDRDINDPRFFRALDRGVMEHHSRPSGLPLVLVGMTENLEAFRRGSQNSSLMNDGVRFDPGSLSPERLREEVWRVVQPHYLQRLAGLVDSFQEARAKRLASGDVSDIAQAAVAGRVGTLLLDADRTVPGTLDRASGRINFGDLTNPSVDDLLDELAEFVLAKGGEVVVVPADRMPTQSGAAAIYRF